MAPLIPGATDVVAQALRTLTDALSAQAAPLVRGGVARMARQGAVVAGPEGRGCALQPPLPFAMDDMDKMERSLCALLAALSCLAVTLFGTGD